jgi:predicted dehydrogenase
MNTQVPTLRVGMVGYAFMGAAHSQAWRSAHRFFELPMTPQMVALGGRDPAKLAAAAHKQGWASTELDWRDLVARDDIDLVDVCTPGDSHAEIAIAALEAGKHVLCEKPLANTVEEAEAMVAAAGRAAAHGVRAMVGFTYRRVPAIALARRLVADGRLGTIRHVRASYLQDWIADPEAPFSWRLDRDRAGSGALGDIAAHIIDLTQFITGDRIATVTGVLETFVKERPVHGSERAQVTVDDAVAFLARFGGGATATFEATRMATGRKNAIRIELNGELGSLAFDFEDMNVLHFHDATEDSSTAGFRRILVTEASHPYLSAWWPPGHLLGYEHAFVNQAADLVRDIAAGVDPAPSFSDGLQVQRVMAAVAQSASDETWCKVLS